MGGWQAILGAIMLVLVPEYTYLDIYTSTYISERCTSADKSYKLSTHALGGGEGGRLRIIHQYSLHINRGKSIIYHRKQLILRTSPQTWLKGIPKSFAKKRHYLYLSCLYFLLKCGLLHYKTDIASKNSFLVALSNFHLIS